jgi:hypothetical protein
MFAELASLKGEGDGMHTNDSTVRGAPLSMSTRQKTS